MIFRKYILTELQPRKPCLSIIEDVLLFFWKCTCCLGFWTFYIVNSSVFKQIYPSHNFQQNFQMHHSHLISPHCKVRICHQNAIFVKFCYIITALQTVLPISKKFNLRHCLYFIKSIKVNEWRSRGILENVSMKPPFRYTPKQGSTPEFGWFGHSEVGGSSC